MTSHSPTPFIKPHKWIVYRLTDGRVRAAMIKNYEDLKYYKAREDIAASVFITAFNRNEAWHKGKPILQNTKIQSDNIQRY